MYKHLEGPEDSILWSSLVLRWSITNERCVTRQFSLKGYCLEGDHATFCPCFIGYCVGKAYINKFKQDYFYSYKGCFLWEEFDCVV